MDREAKLRIEKYEAKLDVHGPEPAFNEDGVDMAQIRNALDKTPLERLLVLQSWVAALKEIKVVREPR